MTPDPFFGSLAIVRLQLRLNVEKLVAGCLEVPGVFAVQDADPARSALRATDGVLAENEIMMVAVDDDARPCRFAAFPKAVVQNAVPFEDIAVRAHRLTLPAEQHSRASVAQDHVVAEQIVGVLVADGDAHPLVRPDLVVLEQAV